MSASNLSVTLRVGTLALVLVCMGIFVIQRQHGENTLFRRFLPFLSFTNQDHLSQYQTLSNSHPFQIKHNSKHILSRYLRHQPEYGPFHNALAVVFQETPLDEPLLLTLDPFKKTLRFHSLAATRTSEAQQLWIIPHGNYAVGVGEPPAGASPSGFEIDKKGHLTFNGEENWGYCRIPETRGVALYWFGDEDIPIPKGCVSDVILTRADYDFPMIEEGEPTKRRVKRRFHSVQQERN